MKKILLICFFALSGIAVKAQGIFRTINLAETFFAQLDSGNYAKAHQFFDAAPARKLQDLMAEQSKDAYARSKDTSKVGAKLLAEGIALLNKTKTFTGNTPAQDSLYLGLPTAYWADLNANY